MIASGELGDRASIHIWDSNTQHNISIIKTIHELGISLLSFVKKGEFIASCGLREHSSIFVYNVRDGSIILSTYVSKSIFAGFPSMVDCISRFQTSLSSLFPPLSLILWKFTEKMVQSRKS